MSIGGPNAEGLEMMERDIKKRKVVQRNKLMANKNFLSMLKEYNLKVKDFTCYKCMASLTCMYAWDPYNTHDDCLLLK